MATLDYVLERYVKRQGRGISPNDNRCKRHAMQLVQSIEKRVEGSNPRLAKVQRKDSESLLYHQNGVSYNFHYLVIADDPETNIPKALDPYSVDLVPVPVVDYITATYANPQDAEWGTPQL